MEACARRRVARAWPPDRAAQPAAGRDALPREWDRQRLDVLLGQLGLLVHSVGLHGRDLCPPPDRRTLVGLSSAQRYALLRAVRSVRSAGSAGGLVALAGGRWPCRVWLHHLAGGATRARRARPRCVTARDGGARRAALRRAGDGALLPLRLRLGNRRGLSAHRLQVARAAGTPRANNRTRLGPRHAGRLHRLWRQQVGGGLRADARLDVRGSGALSAATALSSARPAPLLHPTPLRHDLCPARDRRRRRPSRAAGAQALRGDARALRHAPLRTLLRPPPAHADREHGDRGEEVGVRTLCLGTW
mmetsp:Transcript_18205/g.58551  ORF Transcript_18205/g.58551 Transcript_18205/m.58551 type:complete len:304 (+) Transcript_18205:182-1093(+)